MIKFNKINIDDSEFVNEIRNSCVEYLHDSRTFSISETKDWINNTNPDFWIINYDDINIGYIRLSNYSEQNKNIYIGMDLHEKYRGKGYSYESYKKFIPYIFEKLNLNKISLEVLENNTRAINLYKKLGFILEGVKREEVYKNYEYINSIIMSILKKEYK